MITPRRPLRSFAAVAMFASIVGGASLSSPLTAPPAAAVDKLDRSDWPDICVPSATYDIDQRYRPAEIAEANCREFVVGDDRRPRRFVATVPRSVVAAKEPVPVVFMLHGSSGTGEQYWSISKWRELAVMEGFIAVFPSGLSYLLDKGGTITRSTKWHGYNTACEALRPADLADDVAFIEAIVADLRRELPVDDDRIYVAGFSSGGGLANRLAVESTDTFAAAASWAGGLDGCGLEPWVPPADPIPFWFGVGGDDDRWHDLGGVTPVPGDPEDVASAFRDELAVWTDAFSLEPKISSVEPIEHLAQHPQINPMIDPDWGPVLVWDTPLGGNTSGNAFFWTTLDGVGHKYPNAWPGFVRQTVASEGVSAALMHWQFFLDNPR